MQNFTPRGSPLENLTSHLVNPYHSSFTPWQKISIYFTPTPDSSPLSPKKNTATRMSMTLLTREFGKFSNLKDWRYKSQAQLTKYHSTFILSKNIHVFLNWIARLSEFLISFPRFCCYLIVDIKNIFCNDHLATLSFYFSLFRDRLETLETQLKQHRFTNNQAGV